MWRDHRGRTWVAVGPTAERLADRTVREVASGTRRGTIEWPLEGDAAAQGLFAARRALLEGIRPESADSVAFPRVEGVLTGGHGIVVERPGEHLEQWWDGIRRKKDKLARMLDGMAELARAAGRLSGPSEAEGLVPVVRPRSLRRREDGGWVVTEFVALVDRPPDAHSPDVCSGFLPPEAIQGMPTRTGAARISWGIGATMLALCRWARATMDGASGDPIESPAGHAHQGHLLADAHARGLFRGGGEALREAIATMPDADRLPTADREAILEFAGLSDLVRPFGIGLIGLLDDIFVVDPERRPSPNAIAERLQALGRETRMELARRRKAEREAAGAAPAEEEGEPAVPPIVHRPPPPPKRPPPTQRAIEGLQKKVHELSNQLEESRLAIERMRTDTEILASQLRKLESTPSVTPQLVALTAGLSVALALAGAGLVFPLTPAPPPVEAPPPVVVVAAQTSSGATAAPTGNPTTASGTVTVRGGTVTLSGLRGVFGAGRVPVGEYAVTADPTGGPPVELGTVRMLEGGSLDVQCAYDTCRLEVVVD